MDSQEEVLFDEWLSFLKSKTYINNYFYNTDEKFTIVPAQEFCLNIKSKKNCKTLFQPWTYKYDFKIIWNEKSLDLFYNNIDDKLYKKQRYFLAQDNITYVDVKGVYTHRNRITDITFPLVRKILLFNNKIYIQKVVPLILFKKLFAVDRYLMDDNIYKKGHKKGDLKQKLNNFDNFLKNEYKK